MRKIICLTSILISFQLHAGSGKEILDLNNLKNIFDLSVFKDLQVQYRSCDEQQIVNIESSYNQCVEDICGEIENNKNYNIYFAESLKQKAPNLRNIPKDFSDKIKNYGTLDFEYKKEKYDKLKKLIESNDYNVPDELKHIHRLGFAIGLSGLLSFDDSYNIEGIDQELLYESAYIPTAREQRWLVNSLKELGREENFSEIYSDSTGYLKKKYPKDSIKDAVYKLAQKIQDDVAKFKEKNKVLLSKAPAIINYLGEFDSVARAIKKKGEVNPTDITEVLIESEMINKTIPAIESPEKFPILNSNRNINLNNIITKVGIKKKIFEATSSRKKSNDKFRAEQAIEACYTTLIMKDFLPSIKQRDELFKKIKTLQDKISKNYLTRFSSETKESLIDEINGLKFTIPDTPEVYESTLMDKINGFIDEHRDEVSTFRSASDEGKKQVALLNVYGFIDVEEAPTLISDLEDYCENRGVTSIISDQNETAEKEVNIGWQSFKFDFDGLIVHEIGHSIYHVLKDGVPSSVSFKKFKNNVDCLNSMHPEVGASSHIRETVQLSNGARSSFKEGRYSDEDFADMFSSFMTKDMDFKPFSCSFLKQNRLPTSNGYVKRFIPSSLERKIKTDPHSSDFFRLLHLEKIKKGHIPSTCSKHLEQTSTIFPIKDCN